MSNSQTEPRPSGSVTHSEIEIGENRIAGDRSLTVAALTLPQCTRLSVHQNILVFKER